MDDDFISRLFEDSRRHGDAVATEFSRLCADVPRELPRCGQRVVIAAGLIGHGYLHIRSEARVLAVGKNTVKIRLLGETKIDGSPWDYWIHPALIVDGVTEETTDARAD